MRISLVVLVLLILPTSTMPGHACAQSPAAELPSEPAPAQPSFPPSSSPANLNGQPGQATLKPRPRQTPEEEAEALRISKLAKINGVPYDDPSEADIFHDYVRDTYGLAALGRTTARALYAEARGRPTDWGTDAAGFGQRFGSSAAITVISGNVRYAMEEIFREDLRYFPCYGCSAKKKIENALLAEITARHDEDGHRFFTLTPTVADFSGPIVAHTLWYPGASAGPLAGTIAARTAFATRIGSHLLSEFVLNRHPKKTREQDQ